MAYRKRSPEERLAELERQEAALKKREAQLRAKKQREKARIRADERKADTRRKIIAGAIALEHAELNPVWGESFWSILDRAVTKPDQRQALGLDARTDSSGTDTPAPSVSGTLTYAGTSSSS